jgi:hypothetical protein
MDQVKHEEFAGGAIRSAHVAGGAGEEFPPRFDLLFSNLPAMERLAKAYGEGAVKYGDPNWRQGIPEKSLVNHAMAHLHAHLAGDTSEDHLAHLTWNFLTLIWVQENRPELLDLSALAQQK